MALTKQSSQNSIIFFAALGVYLGLIVSGASPGVISQQAALTRGFDISEEIETTDDLDKDPGMSETADKADTSLGSAIFTFASFFNSLATAPSTPGSFLATAEIAGITHSAFASANALQPSPLLSKITVSNLARAGF